MAVSAIKNSFNAGELSPLAIRRVDIEKYPDSCEELTNARPMVYGGVEGREGLLYLHEAKYDDKDVILQRFQFSRDVVYMLEIGEGYCRFYVESGRLDYYWAAAWATDTKYMPGDRVTSGGVVYQCITGHWSDSSAFSSDTAYWTTLHDELDGWTASTAYSVNDYVTLLGSVYRCHTAHTSAALFDATKWTQQTAYEVALPYQEEDLRDLRFCQIGDQLHITHPDYNIRVLTRYGDRDWRVTEFVFTETPLRARNLDNTKTVTPSAATGTITLTASTGIFATGMVGSQWKLGWPRPDTEIQLALTATGVSTSLDIDANNEWSIYTAGNWTGTLKVQRSYDGGSSWVDLRSFDSANDRNYDISGLEPENDVEYRLNMTSYSTHTGSPTAYLRVADFWSYGKVTINSVSSSQTCTCVVDSDLPSTNATPYWWEAAWSDYRGYPRTATLFQQRLIFGGTRTDKLTLWFSATADYGNFLLGPNDDDAIEVTLGANELNEIEWLLARDRLIIGTTGEEWAIGLTALDQPITPTNIIARRQTTRGAEGVQALLAGDRTLFVQRTGKKVRELKYSFERDAFDANDLTKIAEHITESGLTGWSYKEQPEPVLYCVTADGKLAVLTYEVAENVYAWSHYETEGSFLSVQTMYGTTEDRVFSAVRRTIGGSSKTYIELLGLPDDDSDWWRYMDSVISYDGGEPQKIASVEATLVGAEVVDKKKAGFKLTFSGPHLFDDGDTIRLWDTGFEVLNGGTYQVYNSTETTLFLGTEDSTQTGTVLYTVSGSGSGSIAEVTGLTLSGGDVAILTDTGNSNLDDKIFELESDEGALWLYGYTTTPLSTVSGTFKPAATHWVESSITTTQTGGYAEKVVQAFSGADHLDGKVCQVLADGQQVENVTPSGGAFDLARPANKVHVGLPYTVRVTPVSFEVGNQFGTRQARPANIRMALLWVHKTVNLWYGDGDTFYEDKFPEWSDSADQQIAAYTGERRVEFPGKWDRRAKLVIEQRSPLPVTLLSIIPVYEIGGVV